MTARAVTMAITMTTPATANTNQSHNYLQASTGHAYHYQATRGKHIAPRIGIMMMIMMMIM
eukprot:297591-Lingulodinium_polyedra.AAC.1